MENLKELLATCVLKGIKFKGMLGSNAYNVQDLVHSANLNTLDNMYNSLKTELDKLGSGSLFKSKGSVRKKEITFQMSVITSIFEYKQELAKEEKAKEKARTEAADRLVVLSHAKDAAEIKRISKLSKKELDKEIANAEKLVRA